MPWHVFYRYGARSRNRTVAYKPHGSRQSHFAHLRRIPKRIPKTESAYFLITAFNAKNRPLSVRHRLTGVGYLLHL